MKIESWASSLRQYGNGATWTGPAYAMWGDWMGGMMGGSWDPAHTWGSGYGASWMMATAAASASGWRCA